MINTSVTVDLGEVRTLLQQTENRVKNLAPVFRGQVDPYVTSIFDRQWKSEGRFGGQAWAPLKRTTLEAKARIGRAQMGILRRFNKLWASFVKSGGPDSLRVIGPQSYERGSRVRYAWPHQTGRGKDLATRQLVPDPLPPEVTKTLERIVSHYIEAGDAA